MRTDATLPGDITRSPDWLKDPNSGVHRPQIDRLSFYRGPEFHRHSYSGWERNRLFLNRGGRGFTDISSISGVDNVADGRSWGALDFDRDGWTDIALVNANTPLLNLYRNRIGDLGNRNGMIAVRLVGGSESPHSSDLSNRDAIGAVVTVTCGDRKFRRVRNCGEGFAAQNSATLMIGLGEVVEPVRIDVAWPSGRISRADGIEPGTLVTFREREDQFECQRYHRR